MEKHGLKQKFTPAIPQPEFLTPNCLLSGLSNLPVTESKPSSQMSEVNEENGWIREQHSTEKFIFSPNFAGARTSVPIPKIVHEKSHHRLKIPLKNDARSLNIAMAAAITLSEAIKQNSYFTND